MRLKIFTLSIIAALLLTVTACSGSEENTMDKSANREVILKNDYTNEERNLLLTEDIKFFKKELPKRHKNLFSNVTKTEFNDMTDQLIDQIDQLDNKQVFVELNKIVASIGDAHTTINIWDGYSYPLQFYIFDGNVYVINADTSLEEMMYSQLLKIDGIEMDYVVEQLTSLISHENESLVVAKLPEFLQAPVFLYGLGIFQKENEAVFTVLKNGEVKDFTVSALEFGKTADYVSNKTKDVLIGRYDKNYDYEYLPEYKTLCFEYNACADMENLKFADFNNEMFDSIEKNEVNKVIIDLRNNSGGHSEILNPFTKRLKSYLADNTDVKVYILVGRNTFSSGIIAILRVKETVPEAISVGESTGGALDSYGDVRSFNLPNTQIPISYSTKYFEFSRDFSYRNAGIKTFLPDVLLQPTIEDYMNDIDVVLDYALTN